MVEEEKTFRQRTNEVLEQKKKSLLVYAAINKCKHEINRTIDDGGHKVCVDLRSAWEILTRKETPQYVMKNTEEYFHYKDISVSVRSDELFNKYSTLCFHW